MEKLRAAIVKHIEEHDISIRALAKMCDISEGSVRNILKGRVQNPRADVLDRICRACGTSVDAILASQHRAELVIPDCVTPDAKCVTLPEKRVASDAKSPIRPDKNDVNTSDSKKCLQFGAAVSRRRRRRYPANVPHTGEHRSRFRRRFERYPVPPCNGGGRRKRSTPRAGTSCCRHSRAGEAEGG